MSKQRGIYIHIPLCDYKCPYCNYDENISHNIKYVNKYVDSLVEEINKLDIKGRIRTVYIGGGNPNSLSDVQLEKLLSSIARKVNVNLLQEYTIEAKPNNLTKDRIFTFKKYGINRVSMPTQVVSEELKEKVGLLYDNQTVSFAIDNLNRVGITNVSSDLIFPFPLKNMSVKETIGKILDYNINHISCYPIEEFLYDTEEGQEELYKDIIKHLSSMGFKQYDLLNFSRNGYENTHNSNYWRRKEYYGLGAGAHGFINGVRYSNCSDIVEYIERIESEESAVKSETKLSSNDSLEEEFFLGLQLLSGVNLSILEEKYHINVRKIYDLTIKKHVFSGNLSLENDILRLTQQGVVNSDEVLSDFLLDDI